MLVHPTRSCLQALRVQLTALQQPAFEFLIQLPGHRHVRPIMPAPLCLKLPLEEEGRGPPINRHRVRNNGHGPSLRKRLRLTDRVRELRKPAFAVRALAIFFIGSRRERMVCQHQSSMNFPAQAGEA